MRAKLAALLVAASLVPLAVVTRVDMHSAENQLVASTGALLTARGDQLVSELDTFHQGYVRAAHKFARLPAIVRGCQTGDVDRGDAGAEVDATLAVQPAIDAAVRGIAVLDARGRVRAATESELEGADLSEAETTKQVLAGRDVISDVYSARVGSEWVPTIAYLAPVRTADGRVPCAVALWVRASALWNRMKATNALAGPGSFAVLFDQAGVRIGHTYSDEIVFHPGGSLDTATKEAFIAAQRFGPKTRELLDEVRAFPEQFERSRAARPDETVFRGFAPVNRNWNYGVARRFKTVPWTVFYMIPEASLVAQIREMTRYRIVFALGIIALALIVGTLFARMIVHPMTELTRATAKLAGGDLGARTDLQRADEVGRLGASFNSMAGRLEEQSRALQAANEDLERRVAERTRELTLENEQRRRAEARFSRMAEAGVLGIVVSDIEGNITEANDAFLSMVGYTQADLAAGLVSGRSLNTPEREKTDAKARLELEAYGRAHPWEKELIRKDGTRVPILNCVVALDTEHREWVALTLDLTERKRAEEARIRALAHAQEETSGRLRAERALLDTEEQLRQSQKMEAIGTLAGGVAHDFNNLLSVILGFSEIVLEELDRADPMHKDMEQVVQAGRRAGELTRQLLAFSRKQVLQPRTVNLNEVISGMTKMLRRIIGEDIELVFRSEERLGWVLVDPGQIEQVLLNLVINARDAMPQGGKLTIETANVELDSDYTAEHLGVEAGACVCLSVSDTGTGMDRATLARIFEPFFTTKGQAKGTGLGLSTVHGIVKQSGGHVWVYSEVGKGTSFKVYLPETERSANEQERVTRPLPTLRGSETILLVEDDEQVRLLAATILRRHGYHVLEASSGGEALLICERHEQPIQLLVTDVVMPTMGGRELWARLAPLRPSMRVLFMSGYTDDAIVRHGVLGSEFEFVQKPLAGVPLLTKVRAVLDASGSALR